MDYGKKVCFVQIWNEAEGLECSIGVGFAFLSKW